MSKAKNIQLIEQFVDENANNYTASTLKLYKSQLNTMADKFSFKTRQSTLLKYFNNIDNVNTKSILRNYFNSKTDLLRDLREGNFKDIETHRKKSLATLDESLISYDELMKKLNAMDSKWYMLNYMYIYYGLRNKDLNVRYYEDLMEPEDRKKENVVIYEDGAVEFYINVYKTAKSYNEKVLKVTDEKFIKIFLEQNLKDGGYLFSKAGGEPYTQYSFNVISARHSIDKLGETKIMKILVKHYLDDNNFKRLNELQSSRGSSLTTILKSYNLYNT
jgi:hypothetical protein